MNRFLTALTIILAFSFSVSAQEHTRRRPPTPPAAPSTAPPAVDNGGWVSFTSEEGRFTVLMPEIPTDQAKTVQSEHGPYTTHLFIVRDTGNVYLIGWVDYDPRFNFNRQQELEANRDNFVKGVKAKLVDSRAVMLDGYQAIEFIAETDDRVFTSRVYLVGRRPYQIVIGSPKGQDDPVSLHRFFNSFKISRP
jgi:hypothetical protein